MKNKICALIIDPSDRVYNLHTNYESWMENEIDVVRLHDDKNVFKVLCDNKTVDVIVTFGNWEQYSNLASLPHEFRKKWVSLDEGIDSPSLSGIIINVFKNNMLQTKDADNPLFSIITPTYKTSNEFIDRLYQSLVNQKYTNWEWVILDDSPNSVVIDYIKSMNDPRIVIFKNVTNHGCVGFNKRVIGMACNGDYVVEVDHDDELLPDALLTLYYAFKAYPDAGFAYSRALELVENGVPVDYGPDWGYGEGSSVYENINDKVVLIMDTPNINCKSIRGIYSAPNHVRVWSKDVYLKINGHNGNLSIVDDYELLVRTFLNTKMIKIEKTLYIQHREKETTQDVRYKEIQRVNKIVYETYDKLIHDRIIELGFKDDIWCTYLGSSDLIIQTENLPPINYRYNVQ